MNTAGLKELLREGDRGRGSRGGEPERREGQREGQRKGERDGGGREGRESGRERTLV